MDNTEIQSCENMTEDGAQNKLVPRKKKIDVDMKKFGEKFKVIALKIGKRNMVIALSVILLGLAVFLNWKLFSSSADKGGSAGDLPSSNPGASDTGDISEVGASEYFATVQINRKRARDEAVSALRLVLDNSDAQEESKATALNEMSKIADTMEAESNIESLIKAKGFKECVAVIGDAGCNVIVSSDGLLPNQAAQIYEIVYEQAKILPQNTKIIEKKA